MTPAASTIPKPLSFRLVSLDALRGFDMFWIMGADVLVQALGKISDSPIARFLAVQLDHKEWAGFGFYDLIFPLFIFIIGVSLVFSLTKTIEQHGRAEAVKRILRRSALLFILGIIYNGGVTERWPDIRLLGVLQRNAIAYASAGLLFCFCRPRVLAAVFVALLAGYWALLTFVPIRNIQLEHRALEARLGPASMAHAVQATVQDDKVSVPDPVAVQNAFYATTEHIRGHYEPGLNVTNHFDYQYLPGRMYNLYWDPEGYLSSFPAVATCLLGVFAGLLLRRSDFSDRQKLNRLIGAGVLAVLLGFAWGLQFPVVKKIWTSSFVLVAGGWSLLLLAAFYYIIDMRQWQRWCVPFLWIGMNPITLYMSTALIDYDAVARHFVGGDVVHFFDQVITPGFGTFVVALASLACVLLLARFLFTRKIFIRV